MLKKVTAFRKQKINVGISFNSLNFSFVVLAQNNNQLEILEKGKSSAEGIVNALKEIKNIVKNFPCYLTVSHHFTILKTLYFADELKEKEIKELLLQNSEFYFSSPANAIAFDYEFLGPTRKKVRTIACKKEEVNRWLKYFSDAKLKLALLSIDPLALENFLRYLRVIEREKIYAIFVLAEELLQIILVEGHVYFVNSVQIISIQPYYFLQEIEKFFRLYESSKSFKYAVTDIILLGFKTTFLDLVKTNFSIPAMNGHNFSFDQFEDPIYILPFGMALHAQSIALA